MRGAHRARFGAGTNELDRGQQARRVRVAGARQELAHLEIRRRAVFELSHDLQDARVAVHDARVALLGFDGARLDGRRVEPADEPKAQRAATGLDDGAARHQREEALERVTRAERVDEPARPLFAFDRHRSDDEVRSRLHEVLAASSPRTHVSGKTYASPGPS